MWRATRRVRCSCRPSSAISNLIGALTLGTAGGGTNWPGAGYDPETHIVYAQANQSALFPISMRTPPEGFSRHSLRHGKKRYRVPRIGRSGIRLALPTLRSSHALHRQKPLRQDPRLLLRPRGCSHSARSFGPQAALRSDLGDQSRSRRPAVAGSLRRDTGRGPQSVRLCAA